MISAWQVPRDPGRDGRKIARTNVRTIGGGMGADKLDTVRKLLAKAEGAATPAEAERGMALLMKLAG